MSDKTAHDDDFDGIKEEDNPMPDWWLWTFLLSIPFAFIYFIHFHMNDDVGIMAEYLAEKAKVEAKIAANGPQINELAEQVNGAMANEASLQVGANVFSQQCAVCHGQQGEGLIGPNLTDRHFIHGNSAESVLTVINEGALQKGMPAWGQILSQEQLVHVTAFVKSLEGKMIAGKPAEGEEISN